MAVSLLCRINQKVPQECGTDFMWDFRYDGSVCGESLDGPVAETVSVLQNGAGVIWEHPSAALTAPAGPTVGRMGKCPP